MDARARTLEALEMIAAHHGVEPDVRRLQQANVRQPAAVTMLAEAVAALLMEVEPKARASR